MMTTYKAGFDYSSGEAAFALLDETDRVLFDSYLTLNNRDASTLPGWMRDCLAACRLDFDCISEWSVGCGPGSFTGLRIAAALIMGLSFRKDVRRRAVSTASALAASAGTTSERVLTLYDGRKHELLAYGLRRTGTVYADDGYTAVIAAGQGQDRIKQYDALVTNQRDLVAVRQVLTPETGAKVIPVEHISAAELVRTNPGDFSRRLSDLVYLRPAVFVEPKPIRTVL